MVDAARFLHVLSISLWIGAALWVAGDVRRTLAAGRGALDALAARARPMLALDLGAGVATILTGLLLLLAEGVTRPRAGIVLGFFLAAVRLGVLRGVRGTFRSLVARAKEGAEPGPEDPAARRIAILSGIAHGLWLLALAAMVFRV